MKGLLYQEMDFRVEQTIDEGRFEGWASVFDVLEPGFETKFDKGSFREELEANGNVVPLLSSHRAEPEHLMGEITLEETEKGLFGRADMSSLLEIKEVRDNWLRVKNGKLKKFSIGFRPRKGYVEKTTRGQVYHFTRAWVRETSLVVFAGNPMADIVQGTARSDFFARDVEHTLREAGFSVQHAKYFASRLNHRYGLRDVSGADYEGLLETIRTLPRPNVNH